MSTQPTLASNAVHHHLTAQDDLTAFQRMVATFTSPSRAFSGSSLVRTWWVPCLIMILLSYGMNGLVYQRVGLPALAQKAISDNPRLQTQLDNSTLEAATQMRTQFEASLKISMIGSPILLIVTNFIIALMLCGSLNFALGGQATLAKLFAVLMYVNLIQDLKILLTIGVLLGMNDSSSFDLQNPIASNPGFFLHATTPDAIRTLASCADLITLWSVIVLSLACAVVAKVKRSMAIALVFGWWAVIIFVRVAFAAL